MAPIPGWQAQLDQQSSHRLNQLVHHTGSFVQTIRERWATGQFVPSRCTLAWIDDLAGQVVTAERRLVGSGAAGPGGPPSAPRDAPPAAPGAILAVPDASAQQLAAIRTAVRRAQEWEPAAHERAAELQERAAEVQTRLGHQDRADQARRFAALARDRILAASAEQAAWEATLKSIGRRPAAAARPPDPTEPTT
jgi:hypothetical protein